MYMLVLIISAEKISSSKITERGSGLNGTFATPTLSPLSGGNRLIGVV